MSEIITPKQELESALGSQVLVYLKSNQTIEGQLQSFDEYMNLRMRDCVFEGHKIADLLLRCNNVLYIRTKK